MSKPVVIFGCGGKCHVVIDILSITGREIAAIVDENMTYEKLPINTSLYHSEDEYLSNCMRDDYDVLIGVGKMPYSNTRQKLWDKLVSYHLVPCQLIHPSAHLASDQHIGNGVQIFASAVVQPNVRIHDNVIINTASVIEHDVVVEEHSHVAPGAIILGNVRIGKSVFIGAGAKIKENVNIGDNAIVGMGSVILKDVNPHEVVHGVWKG